jgi:N utilization substance protein B
VLALYQADVLDEPVAVRLEQLLGEETVDEETIGFARTLVENLALHRGAVDRALREAAIGWSLERMSATDRAVLRMAAAELLLVPGVPAAVTIDEAIEIAKDYGGEESGRFVNGVLDAVRRRMETAIASNESTETPGTQGRR